VNRQFVYDAHGNVLQQIDAKGNDTIHVCDARDRKTRTTDATTRGRESFISTEVA